MKIRTLLLSLALTSASAAFAGPGDVKVDLGPVGPGGPVEGPLPGHSGDSAPPPPPPSNPTKTEAPSGAGVRVTIELGSNTTKNAPGSFPIFWNEYGPI